MWVRYIEVKSRKRRPVKMLRTLLFEMACLVYVCVLLGSGITQGETDIIVVLPRISDGVNVSAGGYFPLASALESVINLAAQDVSKNESVKIAQSISLAFVESSSGPLGALGDLCSGITDNSTKIVISTLGYSGTSLLGSFTNEYLHLPILSVSASAGNPRLLFDYDSDASHLPSEGSYLIGVQSDLCSEMEALVRLILHMKAERHLNYAGSDTWEPGERVFVIHSNDAYGCAAAEAFAHASREVLVEPPNSIYEEPAYVEVRNITALQASPETSSTAWLEDLKDQDASLVVLLVEGYDGAHVRFVFREAQRVGLVEGVQWFLPAAAAMDNVFQVNESFYDRELARAMQGTLGIKGCTHGTDEAGRKMENLAQRWERLDPEEYPGAGPRSLTADGHMESLLALAYDSVFVAAGALNEYGESGGISLRSCSLLSGEGWEEGSIMRGAIFKYSSTYPIGVTGPLTMSAGAGDAHGGAFEGRDFGNVTYCAVNLRQHSSRGARFETIAIIKGSELKRSDSEGFQVSSRFQPDQTYPNNSDVYPFDRPVLLGRNFNVSIIEIEPFLFKGESGEYEGITLTYLEALSQILGFTYHLHFENNTKADMSVEMVRNGSVDMAASWITITSDRSEVVSFTYPYYELELAFVQKANMCSEGNCLFKATLPFSWWLWVLIGASLLFTSLLLWVFEGPSLWGSKNAATEGGVAHGGTERLESHGFKLSKFSKGLVMATYATFSLMMGQLINPPKSPEARLLAIGWLFASFAIAASYTAELASFLTAKKPATVVLQHESYPHEVYKRDYNQDEDPTNCNEIEECLNMVKQGHGEVALVDFPVARYLLNKLEYSDLEIFDTAYPQHYGLVLPLDSPLTPMFQVATLAIQRNHSIVDVAEYYGITEARMHATNEGMRIEDASGIFLSLGFTMVISIIIWGGRKGKFRTWANYCSAMWRRFQRFANNCRDNLGECFTSYCYRKKVREVLTPRLTYMLKRVPARRSLT